MRPSNRQQSQRGRRLAQKKKSGGIKVLKGALGHRRADKYLFANKKNYRGKSYRDLWRASGRNDTFENWLRSEGIDPSKYV
jgi:hypothetical protein